jgi:hypothetical protein
MFKTVHLHQIVSGEVDPTGTECSLAKRPEAFPATLIHAAHEPKGEPLKPIQDTYLFSGGLEEGSNVHSPMFKVCFVRSRTIFKGHFGFLALNLGIGTLDFGHWTLDGSLFDGEVFGFGVVDDDRRGGLLRIQLKLFGQLHIDARRVQQLKEFSLIL